MCGHVGGTLAALSVALADVYPPLPYLIFAVLSFAGGFVILVVPETLGKAMPQTLDDIDNNEP